MEINNLTFGMHDLNFHESNAVLSDGDSVSELVSKTLYAWREAVSPHLAAERENGVVEDSAVVEMLQQCLVMTNASPQALYCSRVGYNF